MAHRLRREGMLLLAGTPIALLWPWSANAISPLALPALLAASAALVATVRRPEIGIALALTIAPVAALYVGGTQPLLFGLVGLTVGLLVYGPLTAHGIAGRLPPVSIAALVFLGLSVASALQAIEPTKAVSDLTWLAVAVALMVATLQICHTRRQAIVVVAGAVTGLAAAAIHGLVQRATGQLSDIAFISDGEVVRRISGAFGHPNQYAGLLAVLIPIAAAMAFGGGFSLRLRVVAGAALLLALPALAFAYTRGAIIGLVVGGLLWLTFLRPRAAFVSLLVAVGMAVTFAPPALRDRFETKSGGDVTLRADIWGSALDIYAQHPLLGSGVNNFPQAYRALPSTQSSSQHRLLHTDQVLVPAHAQNLYLNVLAEQGTLGLLGFGALAALMLITAVRGSRSRDPVTRTVALGLGAGLLTLAVHNVLEVTVFGERLEATLLVLTAVVAVLVRLDRDEPGDHEVATTALAQLRAGRSAHATARPG